MTAARRCSDDLIVDDMFVIPTGSAGEHGADLMEQNGPPLAERAVAALAPEDHDSVLEIGFGPGLALELLLQRSPSGRLTGVDPSTVMHRRAGTRNRDAIDSGRLDLIRGYVADMPIPDGTIDAALSIDNAHFWPDLRSGLIEIRRVLRPHGTLVIAFSPVSGGPPRRLDRALGDSGFIDRTTFTTPDGVVFVARRPSAQPDST